MTTFLGGDKNERNVNLKLFYKHTGLPPEGLVITLLLFFN